MDTVIKLSREGTIGIVKLEEREYRNTFSKRFIGDLLKVFDDIKKDPEIKVVVVQGYDNYFCCGGTKEELKSLYIGINREDVKANFSDLNFHDLLLQCNVPVIAAMQGHAIGGGLAFGSYADIIVMAEECIYNAVFMKYGFTPGMGATYIIPKKYGNILGTEMLFTARNYYGIELKERGASAKIVKKKDVINTAMDIARELSDKPIFSLKILKEHLASSIRKELPTFINKELEMHKQTFAQPEVMRRIETLFGK